MEDCSIGTTGWSDDLVLTATGDIQTVTGSPLGVQRIVRRLFTNEKGGLLFHPEYGGGLLAKIGSPIPARTVLGVVRKQLFQEEVVAQNPAPQIDVKETPAGSGEQIVSIRYQDRESGGPMLIQFKPGISATNG